MTAGGDILELPASAAVRAQNAGRFVSRGGGTHPRRVIDSYELIFVAGGTLHLREGEQRFDVAAGGSLLLWPGREHAGTAPYAPDVAFYWVHFTLPPGGEAREGASPLQVPQAAIVTRPEVLTGLFRRFLDDQESGALTPGAAGHLIALMLHEVAMVPTEVPRAGRAAVLAGLALEHVVTHLGERSLSISSVARALDCHPDHLGRCFRATHGTTLTEAIHRQRLRRARALLMDGNDTVEAVGRACGFPGTTFFRRVFKRYEGVSPSDFRRLHARVHLNTD